MNWAGRGGGGGSEHPGVPIALATPHPPSSCTTLLQRIQVLLLCVPDSQLFDGAWGMASPAIITKELRFKYIHQPQTEE